MSFKSEVLTSEIARNVQCFAQPEYSKITTPDGEHSVVLHAEYMKYAERIKNLEVYEDDVWLISYPKTGTTWAQEMIWLILNNLDYETAKSVVQSDRFPFFDHSAITPNRSGPNTLNIIEELPRPRFIKSHLPRAFLPDQLWTKKPKIVYITRNPKDTAISYYHHYRHIHGYPGSKEDFLVGFLNNCVTYSPFFSHVMEFWKIRNEKNVFYVNYEDMQKDLRTILIQLAEFLDKTLPYAEINDLIQHLSFNSMRSKISSDIRSFSIFKKFISENKATNKEGFMNRIKMRMSERNEVSSKENFNFIRKGKSGSYETEMTAEMNERFDKWIEESLQGTNLKFQY